MKNEEEEVEEAEGGGGDGQTLQGKRDSWLHWRKKHVWERAWVEGWYKKIRKCWPQSLCFPTSHQHSAEDIDEGPTTLSKVVIRQGMRPALREEINK